MKFVKKLIAVLIATTLVPISALNSVCMAVRDNRGVINVWVDQIRANWFYALTMLDSIDKSVGLRSSDQDGNYLKMDKLSDEEKKIYDQIVDEVNKIKRSISQRGNDYDVKLAKAIFFWVRNNITYDKLSAEGSLDENSFEGKMGIKSVYKNRKPQDALTTFKNRMGVCLGFNSVAQLMMKIAGLPCLFVGNHGHEFGAVWIDSLGGWAFFDATCTPELKNAEEQASKDRGVSADIIALDDNFTAVSELGKHTLQEDNKYFIAQGLGGHFVYNVGDQVTNFFEMSLNFDGACYMPFPAVLIIHSNNNSVSVDERMLKMNRKCKIAGNIEDIQNFDVFIRNFVKVDISESNFKKVLQKGGFEFNLSCGGKQSKLGIKPLGGIVGCQEVEIPDELIPFLADIDVFDVDSSIKTVKYDLLRTVDSLKENVVIPSGVNFKRIEVINDEKAEFVWESVWGQSNNTMTISLKNGVSVEEVKIPEKLEAFLPRTDKFVINSDKIKTVKYSLMDKQNILKKDIVIPYGVKFEQINS